MTRFVQFPLTIFYDAACPLCASEMHTLKAADIDSKLELVDCSSPDFDDGLFTQVGISRNSMLQIIRARDASGNWFRGVEVFEIAYDAAGFALLAQLWRHPTLRPWWDRIYPWIARNRYTLSRLGLPRLFRLLANRRASQAAVRASRGCNANECKPKHF